MVLQVVVVNQVKGGFAEWPDPETAGKHHEVNQSWVKYLTIIFESSDAIEFIRVALKACLSKRRIDVVIGVTVSASVGVSDGKRRLPVPLNLCVSPTSIASPRMRWPLSEHGLRQFAASI